MLSTLILALTLGAGSGLRLSNPGDVAVDAVIRCGGMSRAVHVEAHDVADLAPSAVCASPVIEAPMPIIAFETSNKSIETQRLAAARRSRSISTATSTTSSSGRATPRAPARSVWGISNARSLIRRMAHSADATSSIATCMEPDPYRWMSWRTAAATGPIPRPHR